MVTSQPQQVSVLVYGPDLKEKLFFFISGILGSVPLTLFISQFANPFLASLPDFYATLVAAVVLAPFLEEFSKAFPLFYRHGETIKAIITLGILVGLGFGIFEFLTYVIVLDVPVLARLPGIFFHSASTSITAYGIATNRTLPFYLIAVGLHASNNLFAEFAHLSLDSTGQSGPWVIGEVAATLTAIFLSMHLYNKVSTWKTAAVKDP